MYVFYSSVIVLSLTFLQFFDTLENTQGAQDTNIRAVKLYTSHEGLILDYEEALTHKTDLFGVPIEGQKEASDAYQIYSH